MKLGVIQNEPIFGGVDANLTWVGEQLKGRDDLDLAVLPELFSTGYRFDDRAELESLAEAVPDGLTTGALLAWARELGAWICGGLPERDEDRIFNSAVLVSPTGQVHVHRKVHLFDREKAMFTPGDRPFAPVDVDGISMGMMVCFDWIFPESARALALAGAAVVLHPANLVLPYCQRAMGARAIENGIFTVTANRCGDERGLAFRGGSVVWSPSMEQLLTCPETPGLWTVDIDPARALDKSVGGNNHRFDDRRPEMYAGAPSPSNL